MKATNGKDRPLTGSNIVRLTTPQFEALLEYSSSLPTGTTIGKRWRRREPYYQQLPIQPQLDTPPNVLAEGGHVTLRDGTRWERRENALVPLEVKWWMGEYVDIAKDDEVGIEWKEIEIYDSPFANC